MIERKKPEKTTREQIRSELEMGYTTIASADDMERMLHSFFNAQSVVTDHKKLRAVFFPQLYKWAGHQMLATDAPTIIVEAIDEYMRYVRSADIADEKKFLNAHVPDFIDVMLHNEADRKAAKVFYDESREIAQEDED